ncbi:hypothetical protein GX48_07389 [Paracoccidioides brasiliensis]|nr:hypothetical protein GX48_07389 [Paracoccidioides brasiliensis]
MSVPLFSLLSDTSNPLPPVTVKLLRPLRVFQASCVDCWKALLHDDCTRNWNEKSQSLRPPMPPSRFPDRDTPLRTPSGSTSTTSSDLLSL